MLENVVFRFIKQYGSEFLYGFEKDQIELDLLKGK